MANRMYWACPPNRVTLKDGRRVLFDKAIEEILAMRSMADRSAVISLSEAKKLQRHDQKLIVTDGHNGHLGFFGTEEERGSLITALASFEPTSHDKVPRHMVQDVG